MGGGIEAKAASKPDIYESAKIQRSFIHHTTTMLLFVTGNHFTRTLRDGEKGIKLSFFFFFFLFRESVCLGSSDGLIGHVIRPTDR